MFQPDAVEAVWLSIDVSTCAPDYCYVSAAAGQWQAGGRVIAGLSWRRLAAGANHVCTPFNQRCEPVVAAQSTHLEASRYITAPISHQPPIAARADSWTAMYQTALLCSELLAQFLAPDFDEVQYITASLQLQVTPLPLHTHNPTVPTRIAVRPRKGRLSVTCFCSLLSYFLPMYQNSSALLADLGSLLAEIDSEISSSVLSRHSSLLSQASNIAHLHSKLSTAHSRLKSLLHSLTRIQSSLNTPYTRLSTDSLQLANIQTTCDLLRATHRVILLMDKTRTLDLTQLKDAVKAAASIAEINAVCKEVDLQGVEVVDRERVWLGEVERRVREGGRVWLDGGLESGNQTDVGYALQLFYNLHADELVSAVDSTMNRTLQSLIGHVRRMTDVSSISAASTAAAVTSKSSTVAKPAAPSMSSFRSTLWERVDALLTSLSTLTTKMSTLESVMKKKRDPSTHVLFMDVYETKKTGTGGVLLRWWRSVCEVMQQELEGANKTSAFVRNVFGNEYARLHASWIAAWERLTHLAQQTVGEGLGTRQDFLQSLHVFEVAYVTKNFSKLNEPLQLMTASTTSSAASASSHNVPSRSDVSAFLTNVGDSLSSIHDSDEQLQLPLCNNVGKVLLAFAAQCERLLSIDDDREVLTGAAGGLSAIQRNNSDLYGVVSVVDRELSPTELKRKYPGIKPAAMARVQRGWVKVSEVSSGLLHHLFRNVIAHLETLLFGMHDEDMAANRPMPADGSEYIAALRRRLHYLTATLLPAYNPTTSSDNSKQHTMATHLHHVASRILLLFLRLASLLSPLTEQVKLRVTHDCAQLEGLLTQLAVKRKDPLLVSLHAYRDMLYLADADLLLLLHRPVLMVDLLSIVHYLFASSGVKDGAVHRLLGLRARAYVRKVEGVKSAEERAALLVSAYDACEQRLDIPAGPQGKGWVKEHYPRLEEARRLLSERGAELSAASAEHDGEIE